MRKIAGIVIIVLLILLILPGVIGWHFATLYPSLFKTYRASGFDVEVLEYRRGWFTSDAKIILTIHQSDIKDSLKLLGLPTQYEFQEKIQHGPIIYHPLHGLSTMFGLASVKHRLPNRQIEIGDFISFTKKHFNQVKLQSIDFPYPNSMIRIKFYRAVGGAWISDDMQKIRGELRFENFQLADDISTITMPKVVFQFDQHNSDYHYLLGNNELSIPDVRWDEADGRSLEMNGFVTKGFFEKNKESFSLNRAIDFNKITMEDFHFGPVSFEISADQLNMNSIKNIFASYFDIQKRGELYQSQLQQRMWMLVPSLIMHNTWMQLDHFTIVTPKGKFSLNGEAKWMDSYLPENITDLLQSANANFDLQISKMLLEAWINFAARLPYFNQASDELENAYWDARDKMKQNMRLNAFLISSLTNDGSLTEDDALDLLKLQKENATLESYQQYLQKLYLSRNILRETNYQLYLGYLEVVRPTQEILDIVKTQKEDTVQGMYSQWQDWLKEGYVKQNNDEYTITLIQKDGKLSFSGKAI